MNSKILEELHPIFYPESIAVVGASANPKRVGASYFESIYNTGFKGKVYAVSASGGKLFGHTIYPNLASIPGTVDYAISCIPRDAVLDLIDECGDKGVKALQFFTAGFSELDFQKGRLLEQEMVKRARKWGLRLIGPNCVGVYSPEIRMTINTEGLMGEPGEIAFIFQSGSLTEKLLEAGIVRRIRFSRGISYGNGVDLGCEDFLEYFGADPKTRVIGIYLEGVKDGGKFFSLCRHITPEKPILILRGGRSKNSGRTTLSHTGAITGSMEIWQSFCRQTGVIMVDTLEELTDTLLAFQQIGSYDGKGIALVTGLINGGGGEAVLAQDTLARMGIDLSPFSRETQDKLAKVLNPIGSILHNPLDLSQSYSRVDVIQEALITAAADPDIYMLFAILYFDLMCRYWGEEYALAIHNLFIEIRRNLGKKISLVMIPGRLEEKRQKEEARLLNEGIAVFHSLERASRALTNMRTYYIKN